VSSGDRSFKFHEGKLESSTLVRSSMEIARTRDTGTLPIRDLLQRRSVRVHRPGAVQDSEALIEHGAHLRRTRRGNLATGSVTSACLGEPSAELRAMLARQAPVQLFTPYLSL